MSAQSPDLPITADTVPGRRRPLTTSPSQAVPPTTSPAGGKLPLSATERTRHRRYRHLGRVDRNSLHAVLDAGLVAHLGVITTAVRPGDGHSPDAALGLWAGELPLAVTWQHPVPSAALHIPAHISSSVGIPAGRSEPHQECRVTTADVTMRRTL